MNLFKQTIVYSLIFVLNLVALNAPAQAALISTETLADAQTRQNKVQSIHAALARDDIRDALQRLGVSTEAARERVAALSDDELDSLAHRVDRLPAGGDFFATVGVIFVILLITDILGFTKVFPFTRAQR